MGYTFTSPVEITARLLPGVRIGEYTLSVEPMDWRDGGVRTNWFLDGPTGLLDSGWDMCIKNREPEDVPVAALASLCSFLSAAAEASSGSENADLFSPAGMAFARDNESEISALDMILSEMDDARDQ